MECFSGAELARLLQRLGRHRGIAIPLVEPVDPTHDLADDPESHVFGPKNSCSHHHRRLLERNGFTFRLARETNVDNVRWMMALATHS